MKFSDYFHAGGVRLTAIFFGLFTGFAVFLFAGWLYGVLAGAIVAVVASFLIPIRMYREDLPYNRIKQTLLTPFLLDERVRFTVRGGTVGGYLILTKESMILLSLENGDHRLELKRDDIKTVQLEENMTIRIFLNEKQFVRVISGVSSEMFDVMLENGWVA